MRRERQRDRGVAGARARHRVAHAAAGELVDQRLDRGVGAVDRDHVGMRASAPPVLFLPGFMQHADAWSEVAGAVAERYPVFVLDFDSWTFEERLAEIRDASSPGTVLVGYSMGARLALHAALREPARYSGLVLVGGTAGLDGASEREARRAADEELAAWIETRPIEEVVERWERSPVFATQSPGVIDAQRAGRLRHDP